MAIYDLGSASLAANGEVTGVGTTWKAPLTLIRVGATIIFKTSPLKIYTISEIISDTRINVYNPNGETVPAGTGYAILAHDGITTQGLAQDVAETLRYYQSKETSIEGLLQFIGQDTFDWPRFEQLANQSTTGAAEALASQIAAAESASTAVGASNNAQNSYKRTVAAINAAGNTAAVAYFAEHGIGSTTTPLLGSLDWQTMQFYSGGSYQCRIDNMVNIPEDLSSMFPATNTTICIDVLATRGINGSNVVRISPSTTSNAVFRVAEITFTGATGSRNFYVRELLSVPGGDAASGGSSALRVRGLLDVYSKSQLKRVLLSVDELRNFEPDFNGGQVVSVKGYYSTTPGLGGGDFIAYDGSEPDDGVFTFVTPGGIRWKRVGKKTKLEVECAGVSSSRTAEQNSEALIRLFDSLPDTGATVIVSDFYNIKYGIILPPRVSLVGVGRDSCGFIKTGNDVRVVPDRNWGSSPTASYSVDFILAIDVDQSPTGDLTGNNTRSTRICGLSLSSIAPSRVEYGIYSYISYLVRVEDVLISNVNTGYRTQDSWLQTFSNVIIDGVQDGFVVSEGGTSFDLSTVYVKNSSRWAFYFKNITYSNLNCCAVDYCYGSDYVMIGCTGVSMSG